MITGQVLNEKDTIWQPNRSATRDMKDDFSRMVFSLDLIGSTLNVGIDCLMLSAIIPVSLEPFDWEFAEKRADWEESHGRFSLFSNIKDLLSELHS